MFKVPDVPNNDDELTTAWWQARLSRRSSVLIYSGLASIISILVNLLLAEEPTKLSWASVIVSAAAVAVIYWKSKWRILDWEGEQGHVMMLSLIAAPYMTFLISSPLALMANWGPDYPVRIATSVTLGIVSLVTMIAGLNYLTQLSAKIRAHRLNNLWEKMKGTTSYSHEEVRDQMLARDLLFDLRDI